MEAFKIMGVGFISLIVVIILKQYRPEFAIYASILCGVIIIGIISNKLQNTINFINDISNKININKQFIGILIKITGIAIITEFAVSVCKDSNESAIASKIDFGGKILIVSLSVPIIEALITTIVKILPWGIKWKY